MPRKKQSLDLMLPFKALSTNKLYLGRKIRTKEYETFRKGVLTYLAENYTKDVDLSGNLVLSLETGFSSPLADLSNSIKGAEDVVAEYFNFNDRHIVSINMDKYLVPKGEEYIKLTIKKTKKNIDRRKI